MRKRKEHQLCRPCWIQLAAEDQHGSSRTVAGERCRQSQELAHQRAERAQSLEIAVVDARSAEAVELCFLLIKHKPS